MSADDKRFLFMGQQEDPESNTIEARGNVRIYDGTAELIHGYASYGRYPCGAEQTYGSRGPGPTGPSDTGGYARAKVTNCPGCLTAIAKHAADCAVVR